jgi:hypothetical protein
VTRLEEQTANGGPAPAEDEPATAAERMAAAIEGAPAAAVPDWFVPSAGFKAPPNRRICIMRFRGEWTDAPQKGERQVVCWSLTSKEEELAASRAMGSDQRLINELTMACVRYIDGRRVDWTGTPGAGASAPEFWAEIGSSCRKLLVNYYVKAHTLTVVQQVDFFANCVVFTVSQPTE